MAASSKKRILNDEQYAKSEQWLRENASKIDDPLNTSPEDRKECERLLKIFEATTRLMGDYMTAKDCQDDHTRKIYIANGVTTQEWLDEYQAAIDEQKG